MPLGDKASRPNLVVILHGHHKETILKKEKIIGFRAPNLFTIMSP